MRTVSYQTCSTRRSTTKKICDPSTSLKVNTFMASLIELLIIGHVLLTGLIEGQSYTDMDRLLSDLFNTTSYNKQIRPLQNQSHVLKVNMSHSIMRLDSVDLNAGSALVSSYFIFSWFDEMLKWDPTDYGGIETLSVNNNNMFWRPELMLAYPSNGQQNSLLGGASVAYINSEGLVYTMTSGVFRFLCNVDTSLYPFDSHRCQLIVAVSNHVVSEVLLVQPITSPYLYSSYQENELWMLKDVEGNTYTTLETVTNTGLSTVVNELILSRRPGYDILRTQIPLVLLCAVSIATMLVPPDCGERLSFTITAFLAIIFVNINTMDTLPKNALELTPSSISVLVTNMSGCIGVFWSIAMVRLARRKSNELTIPSVLRRCMVWCKRRRIENYRRKCKLSLKKTFSYSSPTLAKTCGDENNARLSVSETHSDTNTDVCNDQVDETVDIIEVTGLDAAILFDYAFFIFCVLNSVILNAALHYHIYV